MPPRWAPRERFSFSSTPARCLRTRSAGAFAGFVGFLLPVSAISGVAKVLSLAGSMNGSFAGMFEGGFAAMILGAGEGRAAYVRLFGLALCALAMSADRRLQAPAIIGAIIASLSFGQVGHIHGLHSDTMASLLLCMHLVCAAFWLGALAPLPDDYAGRRCCANRLGCAARFGQLALYGVGMLLVAGVAQLWILSRHASDFWTSDYGRMMAVKLLTVAVLMSVAAFNRLYLTPRLLAHREAAASFHRSIQVEMLLGAVILLITAALTTIAGPPR